MKLPDGTPFNGASKWEEEVEIEGLTLYDINRKKPARVEIPDGREVTLTAVASP